MFPSRKDLAFEKFTNSLKMIFFKKKLPMAVINVEGLMISLVYNTDSNGYHLLSNDSMAGSVLSIFHYPI